MTPRGTSTNAPADVTAAVVEAGVVAVLRARSGEHVAAVSEALVTAGVRAIEITLTTPGADGLIAILSRAFGDDAIVGAGTVVTADEAEACIDAGARFLVSPTASPDVVAAARIAGVAAFPGALTPTEIIAAHRSGASAVKLFPASVVGPRYIKDVHGPLPDIALMPTGGVGVDEVEAWLRAGAAAVGLGGALYGTACDDGADAALRERAHRAVEGVAAARSGG